MILTELPEGLSLIKIYSNNSESPGNWRKTMLVTTWAEISLGTSGRQLRRPSVSVGPFLLSLPVNVSLAHFALA